ncbi:hypothetical protein PDJAM_G00074880 [Pangasius djambal]|uniref:Uncharacterized protein n=1 Tax=Pangasius djambal TaxID=1691987 RepID=A0ACC5Z217_9TELE|nr:hypothetical protein [Pangasius djambal]
MLPRQRTAVRYIRSLPVQRFRSAINAEIIQEECKLQFIQPNHIRWNSVYNAAERVLQILKEQGEASLRKAKSC